MAPAVKIERWLIALFILIYVLTTFDKGFNFTSSSSNKTEKDQTLPQPTQTFLKKSIDAPIDVTPNIIVPNYSVKGRQLECLSLISSQVDRIDKMTLVRKPRRKATAYLATEALNVGGDFIEAGVFRGGTAIIMFGILACNNASERTLWLADSFAGLPKPEWHEGDKGGKQEAWDGLSKKWTASQFELNKNFDKFGGWYNELPVVSLGRLGQWQDAHREILAGWFKDTLPTAPIEKVAFLRCDADMYSSTLECLTTMYPKISSGGFVYIDDYHEFDACQRAVDEYRLSVQSREPLYTIVEDGDFHFVEDMTEEQVRLHRETFRRGTAERHIDAVFWRKQ